MNLEEGGGVLDEFGAVWRINNQKLRSLEGVQKGGGSMFRPDPR